MKNKNLPQAALYAQGKKALKGEVSGRPDAEVRRKGLGRVIRRGGALATVATVATVAVGIVGYGIGEQHKTDAAQVAQDKAVAGKIFNSDLGPSFSGAVGAPTGNTGTAPESTDATSPNSEPLASTGGATTPAAASPEGAWTPTPGAEPVGNSNEAAQGGKAPETGGLPDQPASPETGGVPSE